jgi:hypothetical protein
MLPLPRQLPLRSLAALALTLLVAACGDDALSPIPAAPGDAPALSRSRDQDREHGHDSRHRGRRHGRYRDSGHKPGKGRAGDASLEALALRGSDGAVRLVATTGDLEELDDAPGEIAKLQVKAFTPDGRLLFTRDFKSREGDGTVELNLGRLPVGTVLRLQANVRGISGRRTDVVTTQTTVVSAPALGVSLQLPGTVAPGAPVNMVAVVTESTGSVGARADCVLYVDGRAVDRADDIWIDAGDAVTCAFTQTLVQQGGHTVTVKLENVRPAGMELDGGGRGGRCQGGGGLLVPPVQAQASLEVAPPPPSLTYQATAEDRTVTSSRRYDYQWAMPNGTRKEYRSSDSEAHRVQSLSLYATLNRAVSLPLAAVSLDVSSGAAAWHQQGWSLPLLSPGADGRLCFSQSVTEQGAMLYVCSAGTGAAGTTVLSYTRFAGTVTYHSEGWYKRWDPAGVTDQDYSWNDTYTVPEPGMSGQVKPLGSSVAIRLEITDALGTVRAAPVIPLASFEEMLSSSPYTCTDSFPYWLEGNAQTECASAESHANGWRGMLSGGI